MGLVDGGTVIRTGSIGIDVALGGGWQPGTLNEVWGDPGAAKTVLALHAVESMTRAGKDTLWIDLNDGVRHMDSAPQVIVGRPRNAEDAFAMAMQACVWPDIDLIVVDPTQLLVRQAELDADPEYVPHPQREYRRELNDLKTAAATHGTTVLFVSQPRDKERQPVRGTGISEKVLYRVHLHPDVVHQDHTREIVASVKHVPGKTVDHDVAKFTVRPGKGIDQSDELVRWGISLGNIMQRGSWLTFGDVRAQGVREMAYLLSTPRHSNTMRTLDMVVRKVAGVS
jgi:recombination protein RecA